MNATRVNSMPQRQTDHICQPEILLSLGLTPRESEVMQRLAKGLLNKEIADQLGLSCGTVHNYVRSAFAKLGVSNRTEAAIKLLGLNRT